MEGWVKIYRKLKEWQWYHLSEMVHLFIHLLIEANHEDKMWRGTEIKRGQCIVGREELSRQTGISEQTIRTCLKRLKSTSEITIKSTNRFSIVTICNYDDYQDKDNDTNQQINQQSNQQLTNNQPATNQQLTTNKNEKNEKNKRNNKGGIDISFCSKEFKPIIKEWLEYKKDKGKSYKNRKSAELMYKKLHEISGGDSEVAKSIIERSMSNNWDGLFPLPKEYETNDRGAVAATPGAAQGESTL